MSPDQFPHIPDALMQHLDVMIPAASPKLGESQDQLMFRGGQRAVVEMLRMHHTAQTRNILERKLL